MIDVNTPVGTRVRRLMDDKAGTIIKVEPGLNAEVVFGVRFDDEDQHTEGESFWWGTPEAWYLDEPERTTGDELARLMLEALRAESEAAYQRGLFVGGKRTTYPTEQVETANEAAVAMWAAFYSRES